MHPSFACDKCAQVYKSRADLDGHVSLCHPPFPCPSCKESFITKIGLEFHVTSIHSKATSTPTKAACDLCSKTFKNRAALNSHANAKHPQTINCSLCQEQCDSKISLDKHIANAHSCSKCPGGVFLTPKALEDHLAEHRNPYRCQACDTRYPDEEALDRHFHDSADDVHPTCSRCDKAFEDGTSYYSHVETAHPQLSCGSCDGRVFDPQDLPEHYLSSKNHPICMICNLGYSDQIAYVAHGAYEHPDSHCFLCQWQFDTPDALRRHIRHFSEHPRCGECGMRFADAESYHSHLFEGHQPTPFEEPASPSPASETSQRDLDITLRSQGSPPRPEIGSNDNWSPNSEDSIPYAAFIPLPPSTSGSSRNLSVDDVLPVLHTTPPHQDTSGPWSAISADSQSLAKQFDRLPKIEVPLTSENAPEQDQSPTLSSMPLVGTPIPNGSHILPTFDTRSPFSPRQEISPFFEPSPRPISIITFNDQHVQGSDDASSESVKSPQLISPAVALPDPGDGSLTSSDWSTVSGSGSNSPTPRRPSRKSKRLGASHASSPRIPVVLGGRDVPRLEWLNGLFDSPFSPSPSSISPESAANNLSASATPEYLREARAYLPLTQISNQPQYVVSPGHSPALSSPILSSTGFAASSLEKRREVRFEEDILSEQLWEQPSSDSGGSSFNLPSSQFSGSNGMQRKLGTSKLPRLTSFKRKWMPNGRSHSASSSTLHSSLHSGVAASSTSSLYHCRVCRKDPCEDLTATMCGHLFCNSCITEAVLADSRCPVCRAATLLYCLFRIDTTT
ncbi:hypothetical protein BJ138DRAFT_998655 [Hygrophoropsis aurantiaca]|uniref:Uncharacterized protein n=1 Tax=Hygrophoropsis aurantiaca TaxID=72124 RepID=A0ACB8APC3_9AGAM|nr:hypothetical protein BJ138DRAFT_998655 [Hygrophoropsis aurantiaca]